MSRINKEKVLFVLLGMAGGFLILHPFTMLVYTFMPGHEDNGIHAYWDHLSIYSILALEPSMFPMAIAFTIFSGFLGLLSATIIDRKRRLIASQYENEKKRLALETLRKLMVTLSHHLLNANMIIGGKTRHSKKATSNGDILEALEVIEEQGRKIDAVIKSLREITEIKTGVYTTSGDVKMIDIAQEIEDRLNQE
jgi:signal transduction histidine kinase